MRSSVRGEFCWINCPLTPVSRSNVNGQTEFTKGFVPIWFLRRYVDLQCWKSHFVWGICGSCMGTIPLKSCNTEEQTTNNKIVLLGLLIILSWIWTYRSKTSTQCLTTNWSSQHELKIPIEIPVTIWIHRAVINESISIIKFGIIQQL
jgi:hypothetical protein